eukprot:5796560-Amphidinium_carterae.1
MVVVQLAPHTPGNGRAACDEQATHQSGPQQLIFIALVMSQTHWQGEHLSATPRNARPSMLAYGFKFPGDEPALV